MTSTTATHFWLCTGEGQPFLSRLLCDAAGQRAAALGGDIPDDSYMSPSWAVVTCPTCLTLGPDTADSLLALPDGALIALGAWHDQMGQAPFTAIVKAGR